MIDFHSHLDLYPDPAAVAREADARKMYVLSVTTTPSAWTGTSGLVQSDSRIRTALGLHPQLAHLRESELSLFDTYLPGASYVGEIGLDGAPEFKRHWQTQLTVFDHILRSCISVGGRVMSIHSRRATTAVLERIEANWEAGTPILHWFSGTRRELQRASALGCWFSVGPAMLASERSRALVMEMPQERVLTETDGPFAQLNGAPLMPWDVHQATESLAELWGLPTADVDRMLYANLRTLVTQSAVRNDVAASSTVRPL